MFTFLPFFKRVIFMLFVNYNFSILIFIKIKLIINRAHIMFLSENFLSFLFDISSLKFYFLFFLLLKLTFKKTILINFQVLDAIMFQ